MRVAIEQNLVKNVFQMSTVPADEPRARRWKWFENTASDTSALFPGLLEDKAAKLQRGAKDNASGNSYDNEKAPMCADKADAKSPQPESELPGKLDAHARNESQGDPDDKPPAESSTPQEVPYHSREDEMALGAQEEPVSPPKVSRPQERRFTQPRQEVLAERKGNRP